MAQVEHSKLDAVDEQKLSCLMEEWKQNIALYIDQDKRGFDRIKMFLLVHAGLLVFFTEVFRKMPIEQQHFTFIICLLITFIGLFTTKITRQMSNRAHAFILLRKTQGMIIEDRIRKLFEKTNEELDWKKYPGVITTFTREHMAFFTDLDPVIEKKKSCFEGFEKGKIAVKKIMFWRKPQDKTSLLKEMSKWKPLRDELLEIGDFTSKPFTLRFNTSIGHLAWLQKMFNLIWRLWLSLLILVLFSHGGFTILKIKLVLLEFFNLCQCFSI